MRRKFTINFPMNCKHVWFEVTIIFTGERSALLLDIICEGGGEDLNHGLGGELVHGVVLVMAAGEVAEHVPGQLVDPLDDLGHVVLEVLSSQQSLELLKANDDLNVYIFNL